ncbi:MAG: LPXTG cell wall anchor domain-containing protein [Lachnospiraceae bacterium]|nr:LPXTG cell wall anchor domain-containing protein [Lachnospiraceae bacterium]
MWYEGDPNDENEDVTQYTKTITYGEGEDAFSVTIGTKWEQDFSIATGLMLTEERLSAIGLDPSSYSSGVYSGNGVTYYVLEDGHDYRISEPEIGYEYDFSAPTYHPMLVDGELKNVLFTKNNDGSVTIIKIEDLVIDSDGKSALNVVNTLRGYIHLDKIVVGKDGNIVPSDGTEFAYRIELANNNAPFTVAGDHVPWFGVNLLFYHDENGNYYQAEPDGKDIIQGENGEQIIIGKIKLTDANGNVFSGTCEGEFLETAGPVLVTYNAGDQQNNIIWLYGNQMEHDSDSYVYADLTIKQGQTLSIANVPVGTTYTIKEQQKKGYELIDIVKEIRLNEETSPISADHEAGINLQDGTITASIVPNMDNHIVYKNKCVSVDITIQKIDEKGESLEGAVFQLVAVNSDGHGEVDVEGIEGLETVTIPDGNSGGTKAVENAFTSSTEVHTLSNLPDGTYRLREVYVPDGYINTLPYIEFKLENRAMTVVTTSEKLVFTPGSGNALALLKITNTPGMALPSTGGQGTNMFYLLGLLLVTVSGTGFAMTKRRGKAA